ncbi:hypothetical protein A3K34_03135 [candidate division WWE3 bacterium RIFOXYC1_FULL_40_10]|uniref:Glycosyl transferase family 1 n=1 Tax=candidate division WWE3 bacterium RIFOXYA2_FULL_46_9 TaxID=1802636 RepID=A0A1F4W0Q3_UNCKA|nr:MAG: hypothetical protein A3K58_03135 [candidate division WWE3 bacterium RIFOXYB1_FULL_40_22]OGC61842.1 MAG: hypothetical protein A3K37_03135 [candidate division WWE3 bacterium RIFOXYA1_FULL_40_11]OGC62858.1 MAG: hypothetical protein A2264_04300 [candidate division WWE3 bacterium RIFOXYA2_FULL_46_9]OGC64314.1 MAG: hypothetical protein A2326_00550 [candidate division WWE3 bacterium RIFOXYB2_FULL_41_6]OGC66225.1 MAG: hypothetical protein A3K34_03135 [candidate division WWE3 bacterium RIFOXYC1_
MNISVFIKKTTFHKGSGGFETQNKVLCEGLVRLGHKVTIFTPQGSVPDGILSQNGVDYVFIPSVYRMLFSTGSNNWAVKSYKVFEKYHARQPFDLIISQSSAGIGVLGHKEELQIPAISIAHGTIISEIRTRLKNFKLQNPSDLYKVIRDTVYSLTNFFTRQREYLHKANKIVAVSSFVKNSIIDEVHCPEEKIRVVYNGVSPLDFDVSDKDYSPVNILFIGRLEREKGVNYLPELAQRLGSYQYKMDIIGDGPELSSLKSKVAELGLADKIIIHGKVPFEEIPSFYSKATVFLFPTRRYEGFPMVLVEAGMSGIPIIAFDMGGTKDAVIDKITGFLCKEDEIACFSQKLESLVADVKLRESMGRNSRVRFEQTFSVESMINSYNELIMELVKK